MSVWEAAAGYLVGAPVRVRTGVLPYNNRGLAYRDPDNVRVVELGRSLEGSQKMRYFLHELAHHAAGEAGGPRPSAKELREVAAEVASPEASVKYAAQPSEVKAEQISEVWREQIDKATWPGSRDLELKLARWLKSVA